MVRSLAVPGKCPNSRSLSTGVLLIVARSKRFKKRWKEIEANPELAPELTRLMEDAHKREEQ